MAKLVNIGGSTFPRTGLKADAERELAEYLRAQPGEAEVTKLLEYIHNWPSNEPSMTVTGSDTK